MIIQQNPPNGFAGNLNVLAPRNSAIWYDMICPSYHLLHVCQRFLLKAVWNAAGHGVEGHGLSRPGEHWQGNAPDKSGSLNQ